MASVQRNAPSNLSKAKFTSTFQNCIQNTTEWLQNIEKVGEIFTNVIISKCFLVL